jgi:ribosomal protein L22
MSNPICTINKTPVMTEDVVNFMKVTGDYHHARRRVVMNEVIRDHAKDHNIHIDDDALQVYSDLRRMQLGLHNAKEMETYLNNLGVTLDDWEEVLENELYRQTIKNQYGENIFLFDAWRLIKGIPEVRKHMARAICQKAGEKGIDVNEEELQETSDIFRRLMGMHNAEEFKAILDSLKMDEEDWEKNVHANISVNKLEAGEVEEIIDNEVKNALQNYPVIGNMISDLVFGSIVHAKAKNKNISVSQEELQEFADNFRRTMNLHSTKAFNIWLSATGLTFEEFEFMLETELLKRKFAEEGVELIDHTKIDHLMKISEQFTFALNKYKNFLGMKQIAEKEGLTVSDEDVNEESNAIRRRKGMYGKDMFQQYLDSHEIGIDEWENYCEMAAYVQKLYDKETTIDKIDNHLKEDENFAHYMKNLTFDRYVGQKVQDFEVKF